MALIYWQQTRNLLHQFGVTVQLGDVNCCQESRTADGFHPQRGVFIPNAVLRLHPNQLRRLQKRLRVGLAVGDVVADSETRPRAGDGAHTHAVTKLEGYPKQLCTRRVL